MMGRLAALPVVGPLLHPFSGAKAQDTVDALTGPTFVTKADVDIAIKAVARAKNRKRNWF